ATLYDRQVANLKVVIVDNVSVDSYRFSVIDHESRVLFSASDIGQASVSISDNEIINLARYAPLPVEGVEFTLVVEATDSNNNNANISKKIRVLPDAPPKISLVSRIPDGSPIQGSLAFYRLLVEDD